MEIHEIEAKANAATLESVREWWSKQTGRLVYKATPAVVPVADLSGIQSDDSMLVFIADYLGTNPDAVEDISVPAYNSLRLLFGRVTQPENDINSRIYTPEQLRVLTSGETQFFTRVREMTVRQLRNISVGATDSSDATGRSTRTFYENFAAFLVGIAGTEKQTAGEQLRDWPADAYVAAVSAAHTAFFLPGSLKSEPMNESVSS